MNRDRLGRPLRLAFNARDPRSQQVRTHACTDVRETANVRAAAAFVIFPPITA